MINEILQVTVTCNSYGILSWFTCGFNNVPGFIIFITIMVFGIAYYRSHRLVIGFLYATLESFIMVGITIGAGGTASALVLTIASTLAILTILAFAYEHKVHQSAGHGSQPQVPES